MNYMILWGAKRHKMIGDIVGAYGNNINEYDEEYFGKNITRITNLIKELNLGKIYKRKVYYNPNVLYNGMLDYSYKDKIEEFNCINNNDDLETA